MLSVARHRRQEPFSPMVRVELETIGNPHTDLQRPGLLFVGNL
jgi:hypothetical protein